MLKSIVLLQANPLSHDGRIMGNVMNFLSNVKKMGF